MVAKVRLYKHGESPCCSENILVYTKRGRLHRVRCAQCRAAIDPQNVIDPSPYLMRKICAI